MGGGGFLPPPQRGLNLINNKNETSGLLEKGAGGGGVFNLEKTMASVLHKDLQYNVDKLKYKKIGGHAAEDQKQIRTFSW